MKLLVLILLLPGMSCSANAPLVYTDPQNRARVAALQAHLEEKITDIAARYELVAIFLEELFFPEAEIELERLLQQDKNEIDAYNLLALVLVQGPKTDYARAAVLLEEGRRLAPIRTDTRLALALTYVQLGSVGKARAECEAILDISDNRREEATAYLILSTLDSGRQAEYLKKAVDLDPSIADSERPITVPIYIGKRSFREFGTHPEWSVRLRNLNSILSGDSRQHP